MKTTKNDSIAEILKEFEKSWDGVLHEGIPCIGRQLESLAQALHRQREEIVKQAMNIVSNTLSQAEMLYELQKLDKLK